MIVAVISWVAVVLVLSAYASGHRRLYAWCNVLLCVPVALPALLVGAYSSAAISLAFGVIAVGLLIRWRRQSLRSPEDTSGKL